MSQAGNCDEERADMKDRKRFGTALLAFVLTLVLAVPAFTAVDDTGYSDVDAGAWYAEAVIYCREHDLMNGIGNNQFAPESNLTRAQFATVLYRIEGSPSVTGTDAFTDTPDGAWYSDEVLWASQQGLIGGYGGGLFGPDDPVTREQMTAILWRYAGSPETDGVGDYNDKADIAPYFAAAVDWSDVNNIVAPLSDGVFAPKSNATRAQVAAALMNYDQSWQEGTTPVPPSNDQFLLINGGTFQMGSPADEPERSSDEIQHSVTVSSFYMAKTEVSQGEYQALMGSNPSETKGDDLPVTNITWYDAIQYCNGLSEAEGLTPCYTISGTTVTWDRSANGYRLPTEAEWEYAARAGTATPFSFGDYVHNSDANCYNAYGYNNDASGNWVNGSDSYLRRTVEVDSYAASAYGLYNMHGNAAEWVWDWYSAYDTQASIDPTGPEGGNAKTVRGGGWNDHPKHIRSAYRGAQPADVPLYSIGMRPVRNAETSAGQIRSVYNARAEENTGKTLIVYFSQTGNTEGLANLIHEISGADIVRLERSTPYSSSSNGPVLYGEALDELRSEAVPELKEYPNIEQYDTILLGYCNWWSSIPAPVRSFLLHDDFSGKTIIPFCSMGGGQFGQTISAIAKLAPNSVIKEGLMVTYSSYDRAKISEWLGSSVYESTPNEGGRVLIAYFSATNNTKNIANHLDVILDADLYEITPEQPYTSADLNYGDSSTRATVEQNDPTARPAISGSVDNMEQYDVIFLGYPIWWGQAPRIISTFLESYDFNGKIIVPFCTSGSSGIGSSAMNLHALANNAIWADGQRFSGSASRSAVETWVNGLSLPISY